MRSTGTVIILCAGVGGARWAGGRQGRGREALSQDLWAQKLLKAYLEGAGGGPIKASPREQPTGAKSTLRPHYSCRRAWAAGPRRPCAARRRTEASPARRSGGARHPDAVNPIHLVTCKSIFNPGLHCGKENRLDLSVTEKPI